ncbi:MAG: DUF1552 domain-containing protein [Myxococcota bacterium]
MRRRTFLRASAIGGAALLSPMLARRGPAEAQSGASPKRFIFIGSSSGCVPAQYWPSSDGRFNYSTEPLERHSSDLSIFRGVTMPNGGDHKPYVMTTGTRSQGSASFDQLVVQEMRAAGYDQPSLTLCGNSKNQNHRGWLSFERDGSPVLPQKDPIRAFNDVFGREPMAGSDTPPMDPGGPNPRNVVDRAILETVRGDLSALEPRLSPNERVRLVEHREAVTRLQATFSDQPSPTPTSGACGEGEDVFLSAPDGYLNRCLRHMDLIALSFACDRRRVASFLMTPLGHDSMGRGNYRGSGYTGVIPGLSASDEVDSSGPGDLHQTVAHGWKDNGQHAETIARIHRAEAGVVAYLIDRLKGIPDASGTGTLFDHTAIYWTNEHAGPNHGVKTGRSDFPTVVIAGSQMGLRVGRYVDLDGGNNIHGEILLAIANRLGTPLSRFGDYSQEYADILT